MPKVSRKQKPGNELLEALCFVHLAQSGKGLEPATHCMTRYGQVQVSDRMLSAGCPIKEDDLNCCPQTDKLIAALERCGSEYSLVEHAGNLGLVSNGAAYFVPLCESSKLATAVPDPQQAPLGDDFKAALKVTGSLVRESAPTVIQSAIQLLPYSCVSTNGNVILEAWHGFDMPPGLVIPKAFADAVCKAKRKLAGFGFSEDTFTAHFEGGAWLRTLLYNGNVLPDIVGKLFEVENPVPFALDFFNRVTEIGKWSQDGKVYINEFEMSSHPPHVERTGSVLSFFEVNMYQGVSYRIEDLKLIAKIATHFEDRAKPGLTMFFGSKLRGVLTHETLR